MDKDRATLTQLGIGPQDVGNVLGAELAHAVLAGLGYSIYEGTWIIPQIGVGPHLHVPICMATTNWRLYLEPGL